MAEALLTVAEMARADALAIAGGLPGTALMESAGNAVAGTIVRRWRPRPTVVLCGPGNNGGDGFVAARRLQDYGWPVRLALLGPREALKGDAAHHAALWEQPVAPLSPAVVAGAGLVVDALFGAGLSRPVEGIAAETLRAVAASGSPVVAVDVPSGVQGDTGAVHGAAVPATITVTFFRRKPGHLLEPGRSLCGPVQCVDIGIPHDVLDRIGVRLWVNEPSLWRGTWRWRGSDDHKYRFGHAVVVGGGQLAGAARLAGHAAARVGAGLVTVAAPAEALALYATLPAAILLAPLGLEGLLADTRRNAWLLGPGGGAGPSLRTTVAAVLAAGRSVVLDADALTSFSDRPGDLFARIGGPTILTPHDGEFARLFPDVRGDRLTRARAAAAASGAVLVVKGSDTVVAAPDGRASINGGAPPWLATAGTGDVLAGLCVGLLAQGLPPFEAASAAVWLHAAAARGHGPGMIADDLSPSIPGILRTL